MTPTTPPPPPSNTPFWAQWGADSQHSGMVAVAGQNPAHQLADIVYDPFTQQEQAESAPVVGEAALLAHYQAPLIDGNDVYMVAESGTYIACNPAGAWARAPFPACGPNAWNSKVWGETRFAWEANKLAPIWTYNSDWKPEPSGRGLGGWEPVFHPADANGFIYVPGAGGTLWKVNKKDGSVASHVNPFAGTAVAPNNTYVSSPLSVDPKGNVYYNVVELADPSLGDPWVNNDSVGAWLVKVTPADAASTVAYATLVPNAPAASAQNCPGTFGLLGDNGASLPWPPSATAVPPTLRCGSQRPGINLAPAIASDGTIYTGSRAHFDHRVTYLVAVNPDLTLKWSASMQNLLSDGCGVLVPIGPTNATPNACRLGATLGVDPTTNAKGSALIEDAGSSSPTALPDGSVLFPALAGYNGSRGHLLKFDAAGNFVSAFDFGWDSTPAVYSHDNTYSIIIKDNHYATPLYCNYNNPLCTPVQAAFYITQLSANMQVEWKFQSTNTQSCSRNADGSLNCVSDHPSGFEWCINAPAVDQNGTVYANSEDGNLYTLPQGNTGIFTQPKGSIFLNLAIGAAYTPLSLGSDGKIYTENDGHMFVVGN